MFSRFRQLIFQGISDVFYDVSAPETLSEIEVIVYTNCTGIMTAAQTLVVDGSLFEAIPVTFDFDPAATATFITHNFPDVTLTSFTAGQTLSFVHASAINR